MGAQKKVIRLAPPDKKANGFHAERVRNLQPRGMSREEGFQFRRIAMMLSECDRLERRYVPIIVESVRVSIELKAMEKWLCENGSFYEVGTPGGIVRKEQPELKHAMTLRRILIGLYKDLALTPVAEKRLAGGSPEEEKNPFREL